MTGVPSSSSESAESPITTGTAILPIISSSVDVKTFPSTVATRLNPFDVIVASLPKRFAPEITAVFVATIVFFKLMVFAPSLAIPPPLMVAVLSAIVLAFIESVPLLKIPPPIVRDVFPDRLLRL